MKKPFLFSILFLLFFCCKGYADDSLNNNDISELFPEPIGLPQRAIRFEPDLDDLDNDGLKNADEERYGTDPNDPDTDNNGFTDLWDIEHGTESGGINTSRYLQVKDFEKGTGPVKASDATNDKLNVATILSPFENPDEITPDTSVDDIENVPPVPGAENDLPSFPWNEVNTLPEETGEEETENTDEYADIIPPILDNDEERSFSKDNAKKNILKNNLNDLTDEENNEQTMLNRTTTAPDLTPIYMLLLLNDNDGDGLDDDWEMAHFGSLSYGADDDPDADNLSNLNEYNNHTDPNNPDSDLDGLTDGFEVLNGLNPNDTDSDDDTMADGWEVAYGLDPLVNDAYSDMDNDGYPNYFEYASQTDPTDSTSHPSGIVYNFNYDNNGNLAAMQRRE